MIRHRIGLAGGCKTALVCCAVLLHGALVSAPAAAQEELNYTISVASSRSVILVCEPLVLDVAVRNDGGSRVEFPEMLEGVTFPLSFEVIGRDGEMWLYGPLRQLEREEGPKVLLAPGEVYRYRKNLLYGVWRSPPGAKEAKRTAYAFPKPGDYDIRVAFRVVHQRQERRFESPRFKVTVVEPTGREREALELFRGTKQAEFIEDLTKRIPPPELRRLATEYPETVYGRYARFYLARTVLEHRFDWEEARRARASELAGLNPTTANRRLREEVYRKTAAEFADLARSEPAFPLADQCLLYQADCYLNSPADRRAEAVKVLEDLVAKYPESPVAVEARKRLEKLVKKAPAPTTQPSAP